jgi:hypothetical protein
MPIVAGVIDGGDIASVKFTANYLGCEIRDQTCICHKLNNIIKRILEDYFLKTYLIDLRTFIKRIRQSKPFEDLWDQCCKQFYEKTISLPKDTPTRWSSTINMLKKATEVKLAIERMYNITQGNKDHRVYMR